MILSKSYICIKLYQSMQIFQPAFLQYYDRLKKALPIASFPRLARTAPTLAFTCAGIAAAYFGLHFLAAALPQIVDKMRREMMFRREMRPDLIIRQQYTRIIKRMQHKKVNLYGYRNQLTQIQLRTILNGYAKQLQLFSTRLDAFLTPQTYFLQNSSTSAFTINSIKLNNSIRIKYMDQKGILWHQQMFPWLKVISSIKPCTHRRTKLTTGFVKTEGEQLRIGNSGEWKGSEGCKKLFTEGWLNRGKSMDKMFAECLERVQPISDRIDKKLERILSDQ